jgi:FMN-dependent NADH-azoreductase
MGKIFKGALLGAVSALGAYYYKNPKELEKHKELLKENTKTGIEKLTAIINEKTQELEARTQEEKDLAKEKLEELTATAEFEKVEENFHSLYYIYSSSFP